MTSNNDIQQTANRRPVYIAAAWDMLCVLAGVLAMVFTGEIAFLIGGLVLGTVPLLFVIVRFTQQNGPRSKGIVQ